MIAVKIQGRLGNQLFQYATAYALARKNNTYVVLDFLDYDYFVKDSSGNSIKARILFLDEYNIIAQYGCLLIPSQTYYRRVHALLSLIRKMNVPMKVALFLKRYLTRIYCLKTFNNHHVKYGYSDEYVQSLFRLGNNVYLDGWFQCHTFFEEYRSDILSQCTLRNPLGSYSLEYEKIILSKKQSVGVHIRRTDVVTIGNLVGIDYYLAAIHIMQKKLPHPHYFFFSDDPAWVKRQAHRFSHIPFTIMDGNSLEKGYEDLYLLSKCKHQIIASSTFSWWGAWLNTHRDKIVILPFIRSKEKEGYSINDTDVPQAWIKIPI